MREPHADPRPSRTVATTVVGFFMSPRLYSQKTEPSTAWRHGGSRRRERQHMHRKPPARASEIWMQIYSRKGSARECRSTAEPALIVVLPPRCYPACMRSLPWSITLALAAVVTTGCQNSGGSIPLSDFESKVRQAACELDVECNEFPDVSACVESSYSPSIGQIIASARAGRIQYDGNAAAACIEALTAMGCNMTERLDNGPLACANTFEGTIAGGGACYIDEECASGTCDTSSCSMSETCCTGTCRDAPTVANPIPAGGDCSGTSAVCAAGTYCNPSSSGYTCSQGVPLGQDCDPAGVASARCADYAVCLANGSTLGGTCTPRPAEGQACETRTNPCNSRLDYCDSTTGKCVRRIGPDQPCQDDAGCVYHANCVSGPCVAQKRLGESCVDPPNGRACMGTLWCNSGTCTVEDPVPLCP